MSKKTFLLSFLILVSLFVFGQSSKSTLSIINLKDSQCVKMIGYYNSSKISNLLELFPNYKAYISTLNEIKKLAKSKTFSMRPNYLNKYQDEKTRIFLSMSQSNSSDVLTYLITFTSNSEDSKIESIVRDRRFDQTASGEKIIEIKAAN